MNRLRGQKVTFRLSPEGVTALEGVLAKPSFTGMVEGVDELGAWVFVVPDVAEVGLLLDGSCRLYAAGRTHGKV